MKSRSLVLGEKVKVTDNNIEKTVIRGKESTGIIISFASIFIGIFFSLGCFILSEIRIEKHSWSIKGAIAIILLFFLLWFFFLNAWTRNKVIGIYNSIKNKVEKY